MARRERRPLWAVLSLVLASAVGLCLWASFGAKADAQRGASLDAGLAAQTQLAPLLQSRDLTIPVTGIRADELRASIDRSIVSATPVDGVRIYSSLGRILYAADPSLVGTRPSFLRDIVFEVASGDARSLVRDGSLQTYVPIWLTPGGTVAVAELSQPVGPITAEATADWYRFAVIAGVLLLAAVAMLVVTTRATTPRAAPVQLYATSTPRRAPLEPVILGETAQAGRAHDEQRLQAERRAQAVEENFLAVQKRLKDALARAKELEGRLAMNETQTSTNDGELQAMREQLKETSERLHTSEIDNNALRERMTLRTRELDEARRLLMEARSHDGAELASRLQAADDRAAQMLHEIEQLHAELEYANTKVHMRRFSDALRELDDGIEIAQDEDDLFEHPVIIRNGIGPSTRARR
ncbi:MAG: hypothetical protein ACXWXK_05085 [Actinomycetota bacterium]